MTPISPEELLTLPQSRDTWYFAVRQLRIWITPEGEEPRRLYAYATANARPPGLVRDVSIEEESTTAQAVQALYKAMARPQEEMLSEPERPARVFFEDRELQQVLTPALQAIGVEAKFRDDREWIDELVASLEDHMRDGVPEIPGLLSQRKVSPKIMGDFLAAAADFYRAAPWVQLGDEEPLALRVGDQEEHYFVTVMGQGGMEYGLALFLEWQHLLRMYLPQDRPSEMVPPGGAHSLLFEPVDHMPFDDLDAVERYNWEIAGPQAYPVPVIFVSPDRAERPDGDELLWYTAALRAIPKFVENHLERDEQGELRPVQARIDVRGPAGALPVEVVYPAGELPRAQRQAQDFDLDVEASEGEVPMFPDRRIMEGSMMEMLGPSIEQAVPPEVQKAQKLMYQAWEEGNPARRITLAREALKISVDCADAYVLLAEEEADTVERALELYQDGVAAGRRALGEAYFEENAGHFWGLLETRPFMRALQGMAGSLWRIGRRQEALQAYQEMLQLNPGDNQGVRYVLVDLLLTVNRYDELAALMEEYENDWSAVWQYTRALLAFRETGASQQANQALDQALEQNRHVPAYLTGEKRVPSRSPETIGMGDENEAAVYAAQHLNHWRRTPGAVEWLQEQVAAVQAMRQAAIEQSGFKIGESAQVKAGVSDDEFDTDMSGWQGRISEIDLEPFTGLPSLLIQWDSQTLKAMPDEYIASCEDQDLEWAEMFLPAEEVVPAEPRDEPGDRNLAIWEIYNTLSWSDYGEQGERIQAVLETAPNGDERAQFEAWERYLRQRLAFPFEAEVTEPQDEEPLEVEERVKVLGIEGSDDLAGVLVQVSKQGYRGVLPLCDLDVTDEHSPQFEPVDDYLTWYFEILGE